MDYIAKFEYPSLPSTYKFDASLRLSVISDANYQHALNVYHKFKCSKFLDYRMLYLNRDVLVLADLFEYFTNKNINIMLQVRPRQLYNNSIICMGCYASKHRYRNRFNTRQQTIRNI